MNYSKIILEELLEIYERRPKASDKANNKKVALKVSEIKALADIHDDFDENKNFHTHLNELKKKELIDYSWAKDAVGDIVDRIWLNKNDNEKVNEAYILIGKQNIKEMTQKQKKMLEDALNKVGKRQWIVEFLQDMLNYIVQKNKIPYLLNGDEEICDNLIKALVNLDQQEDKVLERIFSIRSYRDSKYFEKNIRSKLISVLKYINKKHALKNLAEELPGNDDIVRDVVLSDRKELSQVGTPFENEEIFQDNDEISEDEGIFQDNEISEDEEIFQDDELSEDEGIFQDDELSEDEEIFKDEELLQMAGLLRFPEVMEFCGKLSLTLNNGREIDYSNEIYGAYINAYTIKDILQVKLSGIEQIMFIENKTNYIWYLSNKKAENELVIYHGGYYSMIKGIWFQKIYESTAGSKITFYHWGDIDLGGIQIFSRLKDNIIPELQPYKMDVKTLEQNLTMGKKIEDKAYFNNLNDMLKNEKFSIFHDVLDKMLTTGYKLEQEVIIS